MGTIPDGCNCKFTASAAGAAAGVEAAAAAVEDSPDCELEIGGKVAFPLLLFILNVFKLKVKKMCK